MAFVAANPRESMFKTTAVQGGFELPVNMVGEGFALPGQLIHEGRVVWFDALVEERLLGLVALVGSLAEAIPALCQHGGPALGLHRAKRTRLGQLS
jgi:hypothetical protein